MISERESNGDKDKTLSIEKYLNEIKPYLSDIINDLKNQSEWKIQLTIAISFFCSNDSKEISTIRTKSDNTEIMIGNKTNEIIGELFESLLQKYQKHLENQ